MLSSPRRPVRTMRIFSSAENWRRVTRRISFTTCFAGSFTDPDFGPIFAPSMATMGQKSSLPQPAPSVSLALMPDRAKDDQGPIAVAHDGTKPAANQCFSQAASRSPYRYRITHPHLAEVVKCDALADQLRFEPATEAEGELRRHVRAQVTIPRQRKQK